MSTLETEVAELRAHLTALQERVRLDAVADAYLRNEHPIREGDYFVLRDVKVATRLAQVYSDGTWLYNNGNHTVQTGPRAKDSDRLYTIAEVAEIVAKARKL